MWKKKKKLRSKIRRGTTNRNASKKERETNKMKIEQKRADKLTDK